MTINFSRHQALQVGTAPAGRRVACRIERSIPAGSATATASSLRHTDDDAFVAIAGKAANASMYKRGAATVGAFGRLRRRRVITKTNAVACRRATSAGQAAVAASARAVP